MPRVLITAGASGIGRAMAEGFDAAGFDVWICEEDARSLADCPDHWTRRQVDVTDEEAVADLMQAAGPLGCLCANAGVAGPTAGLEDVALSDWKSCVSVNLEGAFLCVKHAAPAMRAAGQGAIVFTSSTAGQYGYPFRAPYAAAKWAIIGLMKTTAMELGPHGIRANAICPGAVEGPRMEGVLQREAAAKGMTRDAVYEGYAAGTSMRTWVTAQDVAEMAVFLGTGASRRISGQVIAVDGHTVNPDPQV